MTHHKKVIMFAPFLYAPKPPSSYWVKALPNDEIREIQRMPKWGGIWNYLWLTAPSLDSRLDSTIKWWEAPPTQEGLVCAVIQDVMMDEVLYRKVIAQPHKFCEWWCRQDTRKYGVHNVLGPEWSIGVLERAHQANARMRRPEAPSVPSHTPTA